MSIEWFRDWFDSKYYHILYHYRDEKEAKKFIRNLADFLDLPSESSVLDIACGKGRHAVLLSELNYRVTGIDLSENSIAYARKFENEKLKFHCHDKRQVFRKDSFDCGLNLFTSFGYLNKKSELEDTFRSMTLNVKKGGFFVIDFFNSEIIPKQIEHHETLEINNVVFQIDRGIEQGRVVKRISILDGTNKEHFRESVYLLSLEDFEEMFDQSGFKILHTFGDYDLNPFDLRISDRLIIIGQRVE